MRALESLDRYRIVLASASPRRRELLAMLDLDFEVRPLKDIDESYPAELDAMEVPGYIAAKKCEAYLPLMAPDELVITADTVVICDGQVLGKPADEADACRMLSMLSGKSHTVVTGVAVAASGRMLSESVATRVVFADLSAEEIAEYVERYRPLDKAGAYGIQEWIGAVGIKGIEGSFYNVMGLPLHVLYGLLRRF